MAVFYTLRFHTTMDDPRLLREILKAEQNKSGAVLFAILSNVYVNIADIPYLITHL